MTGVAVFLMCVALVWLGGIFYAMRKGLNELISGLSSIDQRLARLESLAAAKADDPPTSPPEA
jgi:hypothetical protein